MIHKYRFVIYTDYKLNGILHKDCELASYKILKEAKEYVESSKCLNNGYYNFRIVKYKKQRVV